MKKFLVILTIVVLIATPVLAVAVTQENSNPEYYVSSRDYDWYFNQFDGSKEEAANCGPAALAMALSWAGYEDITIAEIRKEIKHSKGTNMFEVFRIAYNYDIVESAFTFQKGEEYRDYIIDGLTDGNILITMVDQKVSYEHFVVIFGYMELKGKLEYLVYDPSIKGIQMTDAQALDKKLLSALTVTPLPQIQSQIEETLPEAAA